MINVHFSLLPRWRGAAPVERAILAGDEVTGVCVMDVEEGLDTGGVYARREVPIGPTTTADELRRELVAIGSTLLVDVLARAAWARPSRRSATSRTRRRSTQPSWQLDWTRPAVELDRVVRVGGAWTTFRGRRLKVLAADPDRRDGRRRRPRRRRNDRRHRATAGCGWSPCNRRARARCPGRRSSTGRTPDSGEVVGT